MKEMQTQLMTIKDRFESLTDKKTWDLESSFAMQHMLNNNQLAKCTPDSLLKAVLNVAQTGLTLNPVTPFAYLVPRWNKGKTECCLQPSYQGLMKLITDTGSVKGIWANIVYEDDQFDVVMGTTQEIVHKPKFRSKKIRLAYAVAVLPDGTKQFDVMDIKDLHEIRDCSESYKAFKADKIKECVWTKFEGEMCKKTVVKRLCKYLPKTEMWNKYAEVVAVENEDYKANLNQLTYVESLLDTAIISEEDKVQIEHDLPEMSSEKISELIGYLKASQPGDQVQRLQNGETLKAKEINQAVEQKMNDPKA